jgi:predicted PolB exonuclease-like 3'-5' exonuclease
MQKSCPICREIQQYSESKKLISDMCCSICLDDYYDGDIIVEGDKCKHMFHKKCIDEWTIIKNKKINNNYIMYLWCFGIVFIFIIFILIV